MPVGENGGSPMTLGLPAPWERCPLQWSW